MASAKGIAEKHSRPGPSGLAGSLMGSGGALSKKSSAALSATALRRALAGPGGTFTMADALKKLTHYVDPVKMARLKALRDPYGAEASGIRNEMLRDYVGHLRSKVWPAPGSGVNVASAVPESRMEAVLDFLPDKKASETPLRARVVDGERVRDNLFVDFTSGGNSEVYPGFIPRGEVWIDGRQTPKDRRMALLHELVESKLMARGLGYNQAHGRAARIEASCRSAGTGRPPPPNKKTVPPGREASNG